MGNVIALSGGKDSTALALRWRELYPDDPVQLICTPTGDELPDMLAHWERLEGLLGLPILRIRHPLGLDGLIAFHGALPNFRMRWCTRQLKIKPALAWVAAQTERVTLLVGLRADEEERQGIFSAKVDTRFPLREWGWKLADVVGYLRQRGVSVPARTDCARCYHQRIGEWFALWEKHPEIWSAAAEQERATGHTFRSPKRDTWPVSLAELGAAFEGGRRPKLPVVQSDDVEGASCRVCRL